MGQEIQRVYHLPLSDRDPFGSRSGEFMGLLHEKAKTWQEVEASLRKAQRAEYRSIAFSTASLSSEHFFSAILAAHKQGFRVLLQTLASHFVHEDFIEILNAKDWLERREIPVEWGIVEDLGRTWTRFERNALRTRLQDFQFSFAIVLGTRVHSAKIAAAQIREVLPQLPLPLHFHFPVSTGSDDVSLSTVQVYHLVQDLKHQYGVIHGPLGGELFDPRVQRPEGFEPDIAPEELCCTPAVDVVLSVVIPSFNNQAYLTNVIRHLKGQDLDPRHFEVVVVDDGSTDSTRESLLEFAGANRLSFNLKYVYFPRSAERSMGDLNFRAAVARNLGVRCTAGSVLLFLDSDILLPATYLSQLLKLHERYDVVQGARLELTEDKSSYTTCYEAIDPDRDTYAVDRGYWIDFINRPNWNAIPGGWKYTCTHSLSVKKALFKELGCFRKVFVGYGFEDSDLGFRLWKAGCRFTVSPQKVYHLFHSNGRSEFANSHQRKLELLRNTARIFYLNTLEDEVFERVRFLFSPKPIEDLLKNVIARQIWAKRPQQSLQSNFARNQGLNMGSQNATDRPGQGVPSLLRAVLAALMTVVMLPWDLILESPWMRGRRASFQSAESHDPQRIPRFAAADFSSQPLHRAALFLLRLLQLWRIERALWIAFSVVTFLPRLLIESPWKTWPGWSGFEHWALRPIAKPYYFLQFQLIEWKKCCDLLSLHKENKGAIFPIPIWLLGSVQYAKMKSAKLVLALGSVRSLALGLDFKPLSWAKEILRPGKWAPELWQKIKKSPPVLFVAWNAWRLPDALKRVRSRLYFLGLYPFTSYFANQWQRACALETRTPMRVFRFVRESFHLWRLEKPFWVLRSLVLQGMAKIRGEWPGIQYWLVQKLARTPLGKLQSAIRYQFDELRYSAFQVRGRGLVEINAKLNWTDLMSILRIYVQRKQWRRAAQMDAAYLEEPGL